eukprot:6329356-Ditylum_brightwellii.AAC.1
MEENGRNLCTMNLRHIGIRNFFVKDRVDKKEIKIEYCPTEQMIAVYFMKPLQGTLHKKFREIIMGHRPITDLYVMKNVTVKECVENNIIRNVTEKLCEDNKSVMWPDDMCGRTDRKM